MSTDSDDLVTRIDGLLDGMTLEWDYLTSPDAMRSRPMPTHMAVNRDRRQDQPAQVGDRIDVYELGEPEATGGVPMSCLMLDPTPARHGVRWQVIDTFNLEPALARIAARMTASINWATSWRRRRWNKQHPPRTVTVTLEADLSRFTEAMRTAAASIDQLGKTIRRRRDHADILRAAFHEHVTLGAWWEQHLTDLYTELGLERTTK